MTNFSKEVKVLAVDAVKIEPNFGQSYILRLVRLDRVPKKQLYIRKISLKISCILCVQVTF